MLLRSSYVPILKALMGDLPDAVDPIYHTVTGRAGCSRGCANEVHNMTIKEILVYLRWME
jgi:hypothetical protein